MAKQQNDFFTNSNDFLILHRSVRPDIKRTHQAEKVWFSLQLSPILFRLLSVAKPHGAEENVEVIRKSFENLELSVFPNLRRDRGKFTSGNGFIWRHTLRKFIPFAQPPGATSRHSVLAALLH